MTSDVVRANYSSLRASQVAFRRRMDQFQHATLVFQLCRPVWLRWVETAVMAGAVEGLSPSVFMRDRYGYLAAKWIPPKWDWVDPLKDMQAESLAVEKKWKSRGDVIEAQGYDPEEVDARIRQDLDREVDLGIGPAGEAGRDEPQARVPLRQV